MNIWRELFLGLSNYLTFIRNAADRSGHIFCACSTSNMIENICFNSFEFNPAVSFLLENKNFSLKFLSVFILAGRLSTQLILIYGNASQKREQGCGGWLVCFEKQARFWANECLLIKNMTFIIYQRDIAMCPFPLRSLIFIKIIFLLFCVTERVKSHHKTLVGTARSQDSRKFLTTFGCDVVWINKTFQQGFRVVKCLKS